MGDETIYLMINQYPSQKCFLKIQQNKGDFFFYLSIFFSNLFCSQLAWFLKRHRGVYLNVCVCVCVWLCKNVCMCIIVWMRNTVYAVVFLNMSMFSGSEIHPNCAVAPLLSTQPAEVFSNVFACHNPHCTHAKQIFAFQQIVDKGRSWVHSVDLCTYVTSQCKVISWKIIETSLYISKLTCLSNNLKLEDII